MIKRLSTTLLFHLGVSWIWELITELPMSCCGRTNNKSKVQIKQKIRSFLGNSYNIIVWFISADAYFHWIIVVIEQQYLLYWRENTTSMFFHLCFKQCLSFVLMPPPQVRVHPVHLAHSPHQYAVLSSPSSKLLYVWATC